MCVECKSDTTRIYPWELIVTELDGRQWVRIAEAEKKLHEFTKRIRDLEQQLADAAKKVDALHSALKVTTQVSEQYKSEWLMARDDLAAARARNRWIPVTERLPEQEGSGYQVTARIKTRRGNYHYWVSNVSYRAGLWLDDDNCVVHAIAWRKEPKPYKPETKSCK